MPQRWQASGRAWSRLFSGATCLLLLLGLAATHATANTPPAPVANPPADAVIVQFDRSHARWAHQIAEHWVRQGAVDRRDLPDRWVRGLSAIRCTLRDDGTTAGRGDAHAPRSTTAEGLAINLTLLVAEAVEQAQADHLERLRDARLRAVNQGHPVADLPEPDLAASGSRLLTDLQFAGLFEPIHVPEQAEPEALYAQFIPGYHGLRLSRRRDESGSLLWPATALERNTSARSGLLQLLSSESLSPATLAQVARRGGPLLFRFHVLHVVRPARDTEPQLLVRGTPDTDTRGLNQADAEQLAGQIAAHLTRRITHDGAMRGTWLPSESLFNPELASHNDSALAAYALTRAAGRLLREDPTHTTAAEQARLARTLADDLAQSLLLTGPADAPATTALILLALADSPLFEEEASSLPRRDALAAHLQNTLAASEATRASNHAITALTLAALTAHHDRMPAPTTARFLREQLDALSLSGGNGPDLAALPWYLMARERLSRWPGAPTATDIPDWAKRLAPRLAQLEHLQIRRAPAWGPNDQLGGLPIPSLNAVTSEAFPQADWRTGHFLATLAIALRQPGLTPASQQLPRLLAAALAAGFLDRLTLTGPALFYVSHREATEGGVRLSAFDNRMPPAASSIALLALVELLETLDQQAFFAGR